MSKIVKIGVTFILLSLFGLIFFSNQQMTPDSSLLKNDAPIEKVETSPDSITYIKASFAIFTNGTFRIFTDSKYHNRSADVYIEASNPSIVHIKKTGTTWNDFFSTLPFKLTQKCLTTGTKQIFCTGDKAALQFYINGEKNIDALTQEIKAGDKLLVTFGTESEEAIKQQLNKIP